MDEAEKFVAVISPWEKLSQLLKRKFRIESLPGEKKVMVWREDLHDREALEQELADAGVTGAEIRKAKVTLRWQDVR